jgi:thioredoxin 1
MHEKITKIKDSDFDRAVLFPKKPAVVFLTAEWSEASRTAYPLFEATAEKYRAAAAVYEMNVDENSIIPTAYGVRRIPTVLTFADGRLIESFFGKITAESLAEKIEKVAPAGAVYKTVAAFSKKLAARARGRVSGLLSELF